MVARGRGGHRGAPASSSTRSRFETLPTPVSGSAPIVSTWSGSLNAAMPRSRKKSLELGERRRLAVRDDDRADALAEVVVGQADDGGAADGGMRDDVALDLLGRDALPAAVDRVLDAPGDDEVPGLELADEVAAAVEAVAGERRRVVLGGAVVAAQRVRAAREQLAGLTALDVVAVGIDDADLVVGRQRPALGRRDELVVVLGARVVQEALGHAEHLLALAAERRPHPARVLGCELRAADLQQAQARHVAEAPLHGLDPQLRERWHERRDRHPLALDQRERLVGAGRRWRARRCRRRRACRAPPGRRAGSCGRSVARRGTRCPPRGRRRRRSRGRCRRSRRACAG